MDQKSHPTLEAQVAQIPEATECGVNSPLTEEFHTLIEKRQTLQLSNIVVNFGLKTFRLDLSVKSILIVTLIFSLILFGVTTLISLIFDRALPDIPSAVLTSFLTAFSFAIIKYLDYHILASRTHGFPRDLAISVSNDTSLRKLNHWLISFLSVKKQVFISTLFGILVLGSTIYTARALGVNFKIGSYVLIFCCFFAVGHGAYCAIIIPTLARLLSKQNMKVFWLSPADSSWIKDASLFFTKLSIADTLIAALAIAGLYLLRPWESTQTMWIALAWLIIGVVCLLYTFLFPHYFLNKVIKRKKESELEELQRRIRVFGTDIGMLNKSQLQDLSKLVGLYNQVSTAKESAIDLRNSIGALSSLSVLILTFLGPVLLRFFGLANQ